MVMNDKYYYSLEGGQRGLVGSGRERGKLSHGQSGKLAAHAYVNGRARELAEMADRTNIKSLYFHLVVFPCMTSLSFPFRSRAPLQLWQ